MNDISNDVLVTIFEYLSGKDLISCTMVNRSFYFASSNNRLWFEMIRKEGKKFLKNVSRLSYNEPKLNYKLIFLSMFNAKYQSQLSSFFSFSKDLFFGYVRKQTFVWYEKLLLTSFFIVPGYIFLTPIAVGIEFLNYSNHFQKEYEYCSCESCHSILKQKLKILHQK